MSSESSDSRSNPGAPEGEAEADTFPRSYVEDLRRENAKYRDRSKKADEYARRLHAELVRATGRMADPTDLEFNLEHLEDSEALAAAVDDLLTSKPHLAARRLIGDIGQGVVQSAPAVDLAAVLRAGAM
ncbi:hypothetical protein [Nocardia sp. NPDC127526]|uniref:hypothetical protein n=1 Tax=Nocardia sp. NPDC127526 TaxID=3345393 RepID=UPI0036454D53